MSTLEDRLQGNSSVPWIPQADKAERFRADGKDCNSDETLIGVVVDHFTRDNFNGDGKIDVIVLSTDTGEVAIHCGPTVLANQMRSAAPVFGEKIGVKYLGVRAGKGGGKDYHDYRVVTDRSKGGAIHWAGEPDEVASYVDPARPAAPEFQTPTAGGTAPDDDGIPFGPAIF